jgi:hypothetical protein
MNRRAPIFAVSAVLAAIALAPLGAVALPRLSVESLRAAADRASPFVPARCFRWQFQGFSLAQCEYICNFELPKNPRDFRYIWRATECIPDAPAVNKETCRTNSHYNIMKKVTSCRAGPASTPDSCIVTVCGDVDSRFVPKPDAPPAAHVTQPTPKPKVGQPAPGLLESDTGFVRQGPAATGAPVGPGGGTRAPSSDGPRLH